MSSKDRGFLSKLFVNDFLVNTSNAMYVGRITNSSTSKLMTILIGLQWPWFLSLLRLYYLTMLFDCYFFFLVAKATLEISGHYPHMTVSHKGPEPKQPRVNDIIMAVYQDKIGSLDASVYLDILNGFWPRYLHFQN